MTEGQGGRGQGGAEEESRMEAGWLALRDREAPGRGDAGGAGMGPTLSAGQVICAKECVREGINPRGDVCTRGWGVIEEKGCDDW